MFRVVCPDTVRLVAVVVAKVEVPTTVSVPLEVSEEVAVMVPKVEDPPVSEEIVPVTALKRVAKRLEEVALVRVAFDEVKVSMMPVVARRSVAKKLEEVALVFRREAIVPVVE